MAGKTSKRYTNAWRPLGVLWGQTHSQTARVCTVGTILSDASKGDAELFRAVIWVAWSLWFCPCGVHRHSCSAIQVYRWIFHEPLWRFQLYDNSQLYSAAYGVELAKSGRSACKQKRKAKNSQGTGPEHSPYIQGIHWARVELIPAGCTLPAGVSRATPTMRREPAEMLHYSRWHCWAWMKFFCVGSASCLSQIECL